jgi:hypothetical protein
MTINAIARSHTLTPIEGLMYSEFPDGNISVSQITKAGVTWTLSAPATAGNYINGDYWVVGPVTITDINLGALNDIDLSGSEVNLDQTFDQGFASNQNRYVQARNVRHNLPLVLNPGDSLISTIGKTPSTSSGGPGAANNRSSVDKVAVLTCVSTPPDPLSFRPPYAGTSKPEYLFNESVVDTWPTVDDAGYGGLGKTVQTIKEWSSECWLDVRVDGNGIANDRLHPQSNMYNYSAHIGREAIEVGIASVLQSTSTSDRRRLILNLTQIGIDFYHNYLEGFNLGNAGGGIGCGKKFPILFAGHALNNAAMLDAWISGTFTNEFAEEVQHLALDQALLDNVNEDPWPGDGIADADSYYWKGVFDGVPLGRSVWVERNPPNVAQVGQPGKITYSGVASPGYAVGLTVLVQLLGIENKVNNQVLIDWVDDAFAGLHTTWGVVGTVANKGSPTGKVAPEPMDQVPGTHKEFYSLYRVVP